MFQEMVCESFVASEQVLPTTNFDFESGAMSSNSQGPEIGFFGTEVLPDRPFRFVPFAESSSSTTASSATVLQSKSIVLHITHAALASGSNAGLFVEVSSCKYLAAVLRRGLLLDDWFCRYDHLLIIHAFSC